MVRHQQQPVEMGKGRIHREHQTESGRFINRNRMLKKVARQIDPELYIPSKILPGVLLNPSVLLATTFTTNSSNTRTNFGKSDAGSVYSYKKNKQKQRNPENLIQEYGSEKS